MQVKRGDIYYADLSPVVGSEQGGVRPVLVIQNGVTKLVNIKNQDGMTKILDMVPDFINKFTSGGGIGTGRNPSGSDHSE